MHYSGTDPRDLSTPVVKKPLSLKVFMFRFAGLFAITVVALAPLSSRASVLYSAEKHSWTLTSGPVEYRLEQANGNNGAVKLAYFGPHGGAAWKDTSRPEIDGIVDGQRITPNDLLLQKHEITTAPDGRSEHYRHRIAPLLVDVVYITSGDTGVITRQITLHNTGTRALPIEQLPSLSLQLPGDTYDVSYLHGNWGEERQLATEQLTIAGLHLINRTGRSSAGFSPWFVLHGAARNVRYAAQLAYSGNWAMSFDAPQDTRHSPLSESILHVSLGMRFDFGGSGRLAPGASFSMPEVAFTATSGDIDDAANQLHRYQRQYDFAHTPTNSPPLVNFNVWQFMRRNPTATEVKQYADLIAPLGIEALIIDSGWFRHVHKPNPDSPTNPHTFPIFGDWEPDTQYFPQGLIDVSNYVHGKGMKFGVWLEIETVSKHSQVAHDHPDWMLSYNGKPVTGGADRIYLNFGVPAARAWARSVMERLITQDKVDWIKLDYNVNPGEDYDPPSESERTGTVLHDHQAAYYALLDEVHAAHPNVVLENCASGGLRADLAILHHTHTSWTSDVVEPKRNAQLDYGCTMEFAPEVCEHWMTGDPNGDAPGDSERGEIHSTDTREWMQTMMRLPMAGQLGFSSLVPQWPAAFREIAVQGIRDYKRIRPIIATADTYHLTPAPAAGPNPTGWMALEFVEPTATRAFVLAFRLNQGEATRALHLRGLTPNAQYQINIDGKPTGTVRGADLQNNGLPVTLAADWNSALIELQRK